MLFSRVFVNAMICVHLLVFGSVVTRVKGVLSAFQALGIYHSLVNTCSPAENGLWHRGVINKIKELHVDTHINPRETERRTGIFHRLSEFQFVLVKIERTSEQDIRAGRCGAGSVHGWLSAHRFSFMSGSVKIHLPPVRSKPRNRTDCLPFEPRHTELEGLLTGDCKNWSPC